MPSVNQLQELGYKLKLNPERVDNFLERAWCVEAIKIDNTNAVTEEDTTKELVETLAIRVSYKCVNILENSEDRDSAKKEIEKLFNT